MPSGGTSSPWLMHPLSLARGLSGLLVRGGGKGNQQNKIRHNEAGRTTARASNRIPDSAGAP